MNIHKITSSFVYYYLKNNVQSKAIITLHCIYSYAKILWHTFFEKSDWYFTCFKRFDNCSPLYKFFHKKYRTGLTILFLMPSYHGTFPGLPLHKPVQIFDFGKLFFFPVNCGIHLAYKSQSGCDYFPAQIFLKLITKNRVSASPVIPHEKIYKRYSDEIVWKCANTV